MIDPGDGSDFVSTEHSAWTATDAQIEGIAAALRAFGIENVDTLRSSDSGRLIYVQVEQEDGSSLTIGHTYGQTLPTSSEVAAALLEQTFTELDRHMDDPDESPHSSHGMLELTRDRLATIRTLFAGPDLSEPTPAMQALEPAPWQDTRSDDGRWLSGSDACPRCPHVVMAHRSDVGCISCDCQHGFTGQPQLIDRAKSHVLPADLADNDA
jgi:hypothetical protein